MADCNPMNARKKVKAKPTAPRPKVVKEAAIKSKTKRSMKAAKDVSDYRAVLEDQTETICRFRADGTFTYANEVYCRFFGKTSAQLIGRSWQPVVVAEDLPAVLEQLRHLSPRKPVVVIENRVYSASGEVRWMQFVNRAFFKNGRLMETQSVGRDVTERKLAEEALRESEERWKFALEGAGDGMWDWNVGTGQVIFSKAWKSMLGYTEHEIKNHFDEWSTRMHPEDLPPAMAAIKAHFDGRTPCYTSEFRMKCKGGSWKWILARGMVTSRDSQGGPLRVIGTHQDISARQDAREREEHNLKLVAEGAPCEAVLAAIVKRVEAEAESMLCMLVRVDADGSRLTEVIAPGLPEFFRNGVSRGALTLEMMSGGAQVREGRRVIVESIPEDGSASVFKRLAARARLRSCWAEPIVSSAGLLLGTIVCFRRVPHFPSSSETGAVAAAARLAAVAIERRNSEMALREVEERYRQIVETAEEGVWTINARSETDFVNPKMAEMLGYTQAEMQGRPLDDFMDEEGREISRKNMERRKQGISEQHEFKFRRKDGSDFWAWISTNPIYDSRQKFAGAVAMVTDISQLKAAQAALVDREARYRGIMESELVGLMFWRLDGDITEANETFLEMTGYTQEDVKAGRVRWSSMTPAAHRAADEYAIRELEERGVITPYEKEYFRQDGTRVPIIVGGALFPHVPNEGVSFVLDITARKRAENSLRESEQRFRAIFEQAGVGVAIVDVNTGRYVRVNQRFCDITKMTPEQLTMVTFMDITHPDDARTSREANEDLRRGRVERLRLEKRFVRPDGSFIWVNISVSPLWKEGGVPTFNITIAEDISDRKRAEAGYLREIDFNRALIRHTAALILVTDLNGRVVHANPQFVRVVGYTVDEMQGRIAWDIGFMEGQEIVRSRARFSRLVLGEDNPPAEIWLRTKTGELRLAEIWGTSSRDAEGNVEQIIITGIDVTDKNRLQHEVLKIAEQEHARIGNDLHDGVGQTMTGIASMLEALESGLDGPKKTLATRIRELVQESVQEVRRMSHGISPAGVKNRGLGGALQLLAETVRTNYRTECDCVIAPGIVIADSEMQTHLFRIAQEGVNNAMRHGKPKKVSLSLSRASDAECVLKIEDNGSGMKKKEGQNGEGIGVRVMDYRANLIGGRLEIKNKRGGGVAIQCWFPCAKA